MLQTGQFVFADVEECLLDEERVVEGQQFCVGWWVGFAVVHPGRQHQNKGFNHLRHVVELCGAKHRWQFIDSNELLSKKHCTDRSVIGVICFTFQNLRDVK